MKLNLLLLLILCPCLQVYAQDISGKWSWRADEEAGNMFIVELNGEAENIVRGNHCSVFLHGSKNDCSDSQDEFSVVLVRKAENLFQGSIRSGLSLSLGQIQMQYIPTEDNIVFTLTTIPTGEFYIPKEAILQRN